MKASETQLSVYIRLLINAETRKKSTFFMIWNLNLLQTPDVKLNKQNGIFQIITKVGMENRVFTTAAVDTIDHFLSLVTAQV